MWGKNPASWRMLMMPLADSAFLEDGDLIIR